MISDGAVLSSPRKLLTARSVDERIVTFLEGLPGNLDGTGFVINLKVGRPQTQTLPI